MSLLDNPFILSLVFYPRVARPHTSRLANVQDGTIPVEGDIVLGYRLYKHQADAPLVLFFHGNGEVASDYDDIAGYFQRAGASLLVVDYRGYGWSSGTPLLSALLTDVAAVHAALPSILQQAGLENAPLYLMGRSLGSAPAIHLAHLHPDSYRGLIIESGFAQVIPLLLRLGLPAHLLGELFDPIGNAEKIKSLQLPLLVIHGERDTIIPIEQGQQLYDLSPATDKHIVRMRAVGHNDLLGDADRYFAAVKTFIMR